MRVFPAPPPAVDRNANRKDRSALMRRRVGHLTIRRNPVLVALSLAFGAFAIVVGLLTGQPQLATLGTGLVLLGVVAALLRPSRTAGITEQLAARKISAWLVFMLVTLFGAALAILAGVASIKSSGLELAIVLFPLGALGLMAAALSLRYILLLVSESHAVKPFGFSAFDKYDKDRRAKGWDVEAIAKELNHSTQWVEGARRRYEGAESLLRISKKG
jgi:MFS family permease